MKVLKASFDSNPAIGLYAFATDDFCLIGHEVPEEMRMQIEKVLKVPTHPVSIGGTSLVGVFLNGNEGCVLVPHLAFEKEQKALEECGIPFTCVKTRLTALGNNMVIGEKTALVSDEYSADDKKRFRQTLNLKTVPATINGTGTIGSQTAINRHGAYVSPHLLPDEEAHLLKHLTVPLHKGTINHQNPYVHAGIIANSKGCIIGQSSTGVEINDALQALGFL